MSRNILPGYTPARFAWLSRLERHWPVIQRPRGVVGFHCARLDWTENLRGIKTGDWYGEVLTPTGRKVLSEWRARLRSET